VKEPPIKKKKCKRASLSGGTNTGQLWPQGYLFLRVIHGYVHRTPYFAAFLAQTASPSSWCYHFVAKKMYNLEFRCSGGENSGKNYRFLNGGA